MNPKHVINLHFHFNTFTLSHFHTFTLSHFHAFTLSNFHTFTFSLSHFHTFTFTLSFSHFHFHTFTLSFAHFHIFTFTFTLSFSQFQTCEKRTSLLAPLLICRPATIWPITSISRFIINILSWNTGKRLIGKRGDDECCLF